MTLTKRQLDFLASVESSVSLSANGEIPITDSEIEELQPYLRAHPSRPEYGLSAAGFAELVRSRVGAEAITPRVYEVLVGSIEGGLVGALCLVARLFEKRRPDSDDGLSQNVREVASALERDDEANRIAAESVAESIAEQFNIPGYE